MSFFKVEPDQAQIDKFKGRVGQMIPTKLTTEESEEKLAMQGDYGFEDKDDEWETWRPVDKAGYRPKPRLLRPDIKDPLRPTWEDYLCEENFDQDWYIVGGGSSALDHGRELDGKLVYGVNWTGKWFMPTFLQIIDPTPFQIEVASASARWVEPNTQLITSRYMFREHCGQDPEFLWFKHIHPECANDRESPRFAETHEEQMGWAPNSLWHALQVAYWFRPRRIILLGFDWGGAHLFGNGATVGALGVYDGKKSLRPRLEYMKDQMERRGMVIRHVGPTKLDLFKQVATIEEALET